MTNSEEDASHKDESHIQDGGDSAETIYEDELERQWGEAQSIQGLDPSLLSKRRRRDYAGRGPLESAAFSPWLIPVSTILGGPVVASVLTIFADGDPPTIRQMVAIVAVGLTAWAINMGLASEEIQIFSAGTEATARIGVLTVSGVVLWALYVYWIDGKKELDRQGLFQSAVLLFLLSLLFWMGRGTDWWVWLGR